MALIAEVTIIYIIMILSPMLPINKRKTKGFTLIEVLIFITILVVILSISFSFMLITFKATSKSNALKKVKQNGDFALSNIERFVVSAQKVECGPTSMTITMPDGNQTVFACINDAADHPRIASSSALAAISYLTDEDVSITDCLFVGTTNPGTPAVVDINFTVSYGEPDARSSEKASLAFSSKVIVKNQK